MSYLLGRVSMYFQAVPRYQAYRWKLFQGDYNIKIHAEERFPRDFDIVFVKFFERNALVVIVEFKNPFRAYSQGIARVIPKRRKNSSTPLIETTKKHDVFLFATA